MPHDYRRENFRSQNERNTRGRFGSDRERYATGTQEDRYSPHRSEWSSGGFEGERSRSAYFEGSGDPSRSRDVQWRRNQSGEDERERWGREPWRSGEMTSGNEWQSGRDFDEGDEYTRSSGGSARDLRGEQPDPGRTYGRTRWEQPGDDSGAYFGTGSYYGAYGSQPGASASGSPYTDHDYAGGGQGTWRDRESELRRGGDYPSSGDYESYGSSRYGAQSGYGRTYGQSAGRQQAYGQDYRERFAEQRYGRNPEFGYGFERNEQIRSTGLHRGRGPKGYERSDDRLREMICERLTDDPRIDASDVSIEVRDKVVKLTGMVSDRRTKYEIEDVIEHCGGVKDIDNQIRVKSGWGMSQSSGSQISSSDQSGLGAGSESKPGVKTSTTQQTKRS